MLSLTPTLWNLLERSRTAAETSPKQQPVSALCHSFVTSSASPHPNVQLRWRLHHMKGASHWASECHCPSDGFSRPERRPTVLFTSFVFYLLTSAAQFWSASVQQLLGCCCEGLLLCRSGDTAAAESHLALSV